VFSGVEPEETKMRGMLEGACAFLTKPLRDEEVRNVWQHVVARRRLNAASGADARGSDVAVVRQDETVARKRGLDDSGEGGSDKKNRLNSWSEEELHAAFVKAVEQLRGTEGN
jgi:two-component response regulator (ARR-B family)